MRLRSIVVAVVSTAFVPFALACGKGQSDSLGTTPSDDAGPGKSDAASSSTLDASGSAGPKLPYSSSCDLTKPFNQPVPLSSLVAEGTGLVDSANARLSSDELTIYFASHRTPSFGGQPAGLVSFNVWTATRSDPTAQFDPPTLLIDGHPNYNFNFPAITADGAHLVVNTDYIGGIAVIPLPSQTYPLPFSLTADADFNEPYLVEGQGLLCAVRKPPNEMATVGCFPWNDASGADTGDGGSSFIAIPGLDANARFPVLSDDGLTIYYSELGSEDPPLMVAERTDVGQPFPAPTQVVLPTAPMDSLLHTQPSWLSKDKCRLYVNGDGVDAEHSPEVFVAQKPE